MYDMYNAVTLNSPALDPLGTERGPTRRPAESGIRRVEGRTDMVKRAESKREESRRAARQNRSRVDRRREACEELAEFIGRYRGYPLTDWLIQTRQAEVSARSAVLAQLKGDR